MPPLTSTTAAPCGFPPPSVGGVGRRGQVVTECGRCMPREIRENRGKEHRRCHGYESTAAQSASGTATGADAGRACGRQRWVQASEDRATLTCDGGRRSAAWTPSLLPLPLPLPLCQLRRWGRAAAAALGAEAAAAATATRVRAAGTATMDRAGIQLGAAPKLSCARRTSMSWKWGRVPGLLS